MDVTVRSAIHVPRPPEVVWDFAVGCENFPRFLRRLGPLPGVVEVAMLDGAAPGPGVRRRVTMTDDSVLVEHVLELSRPTTHRYRWEGGPRPPFSLLVRSGEGSWAFAAAAGGTDVVWSYRFALTTPLVWPLAAPVLLAFRAWMARGLTNLRTAMA